MLRNIIHRALCVALLLPASAPACAGRQPIETQAATVPADRVDDFLKSLEVIDETTRESLPVSFATMQPTSDEAEMVVSVPGNHPRQLLVSYVTDSPAWKPSYRVVLDPKKDGAELEAWAVVDNVSGEDWRRARASTKSTTSSSPCEGFEPRRQ